MAIKLIANYSKRLGLPGYSSHQYSVSVETELVATADIPAEAARFYQLLQSNVDEQMQQTGFVPPGTYGMEMPDDAPAANGNANGVNGAIGTRNGVNGTNGNHAANGVNGNSTPRGPLDGRWKCSEKQRDLILKLVDEHQLDKHAIEALAVERFGHGVRLLNKVEASGLIDELLETHGNGPRPPAWGARKQKVNGSAYQGGDKGRAAA